MTKTESNKKTRGFKPGVSGNPGGRKKLPDEIKAIKESTLEKAIIILHNKITDDKYINKLKASDLIGFLELAFDRLGLPKHAAVQHQGADGGAIVVQFLKGDDLL